MGRVVEQNGQIVRAYGAFQDTSAHAQLIDKIQERGYVKKDNITGKKIKCVDYELEIKSEKRRIQSKIISNTSNSCTLKS